MVRGNLVKLHVVDPGTRPEVGPFRCLTLSAMAQGMPCCGAKKGWSAPRRKRLMSLTWHWQDSARRAVVEDVATQRATPRRAVQAEMCAIAFSLPSSFFSFSSFVQVRCGMLGSDGLPWWPEVSYIFFPFCDAWVQIAGQVPTDLVEMMCQFWAHIGANIVRALWGVKSDERGLCLQNAGAVGMFGGWNDDFDRGKFSWEGWGERDLGDFACSCVRALWVLLLSHFDFDFGGSHWWIFVLLSQVSPSN